MLVHIKTDGTETGLSASDKINLSFTRTDANNDLINANIDAIEELNNNIQSYNHAQVTGIDITDTTYVDINSLLLTDMLTGLYQVTLSVFFTLSDTNNSGYLRTSLDGGVSWLEMVQEAKDNSDTIIQTYVTTLTASGTIDIRIEAKRENDLVDMHVVSNTIILERKSS